MKIWGLALCFCVQSAGYYTVIPNSSIRPLKEQQIRRKCLIHDNLILWINSPLGIKKLHTGILTIAISDLFFGSIIKSYGDCSYQVQFVWMCVCACVRACVFVCFCVLPT